VSCLCAAGTHQHHHHVHRCGQEIVLALAVTRATTITLISGGPCQMQILLVMHWIVLPPTVTAVPQVLCGIAHGCVNGTSRIGLLLCQWLLSHLVCGTASSGTLWMASRRVSIGNFNWSNDNNDEDNQAPNIYDILVMAQEQWCQHCIGCRFVWIIVLSLFVCRGWIIHWSVWPMYPIKCNFFMFLRMLEKDNDE